MLRALGNPVWLVGARCLVWPAPPTPVVTPAQPRAPESTRWGWALVKAGVMWSLITSTPIQPLVWHLIISRGQAWGSLLRSWFPEAAVTPGGGGVLLLTGRARSLNRSADWPTPGSAQMHRRHGERAQGAEPGALGPALHREASGSRADLLSHGLCPCAGSHGLWPGESTERASR